MAGQLVHFEIPVDDTARGREFWGSLFGWEFEAFGEGVDYHLTRLTETSGAALSGMEPGKRGPRAYFDVDDINAGVARVKELGGEADQPSPVPGMGWSAACKDEAGNEFGLWQTDPSAPVPEI